MLQLTIYAYKDPYLQRRIDGEWRYTCTINPATYSHSYEVGFVEMKSQASGSASQSKSFKGIKAEKVSFSLVFDGTGAIPNSGDVRTEIRKFKRIVYSYQGSIHRPAYLKLAWGQNFLQDTSSGTQDFCCQLSSMDISYDMFSSDGKPLRANIKLSFVEYRTEAMIRLMEKSSSPDMTHRRMVRQGDSLPYMCYEIYGDSSYYLEVAKVNNIVDFRALEPGRMLVFPPIAAVHQDD